MSLTRQVITEITQNIRAGARALRTPKGVIALIPIVVSVFAFIRSSCVVTSLSISFVDPIAMQARLEGDAIMSEEFRPTAAIISNTGNEPMYISDLKINIVIRRYLGRFDRDCVYHVPSTTDRSSEVFPAMRLAGRPLQRDYPYELQGGLIVPANSFFQYLCRFHTLLNPELRLHFRAYVRKLGLGRLAAKPPIAG